ncbi:MAG: Stp1/IreP family PP2C-type Ser/Thr phosphatase [Clostridia bacterium]|nr:Stp1/IreP family PP2C-type Ser/Thr phosphatase [Clostridia bacterium]
MKFYGKTDVGSVRHENQDCYGIFELRKGITLCVVCDGMGGVAGGALASSLAMETFAYAIRDNILPDYPDEQPNLTPASVKYALTAALNAANAEVLRVADENESGSLDGMGTTLVALLIVEGLGAFCLNVGDSRLYDITNKEIIQVTKDHSYVQHLVDIGKLTYEQAKTSPVRNVIMRAVGAEESVKADVYSVPLYIPDAQKRYFLLCTDGLTGCVGDQSIFAMMNTPRALDQKADALVKAANAAGGPDNITVLLVEL